ncbi:MAG: serine/threonine protein phosphatase [Sphingomonas sp.]|uniref:metallophosphoesterase n=1 Tax=Sphingomonas sp. TaxID=28214 RepID=UPI001B0EC03F|nr:metallophosphoesterase [Sphingomonas sp.]MBO9622430.1 serine/threonine protein phosphatase [Sphingomonas sp.]
MIARLFRGRTAARQPVASIPAGRRIYAIGDIHGRLDLLDALLVQIARDDAQRSAGESEIFLLGDLIDRGPQSAQVVERALELSRGSRKTRFLLGNHEEVFLKALAGDLKMLAFFTRIGGRETILSYGVTEREYRDCDYPELLELLRARVPQEHIAFLKGFEDLIVVGDYAFVHAGVRPDRSLGDQEISDLRWIRSEFLDHRGPLEKVIVHGHTVTKEAELTPHRIGLDTGAYASGKLTAMGFEGNQRWVLDTAA